MAILSKRFRDDPRRRATKLAFLQAASELLEEGAAFADLSVSRIAERAGRTRSAFYAHFEDRRELLLALITEIGDEVVAAISPFTSAEGPVDHDTVRTSIASLLETFLTRATLLRTVVEAAGYDAAIAAYWNDVVDQIVSVSEKRLSTGGFGEEEAKATATALVWMTERTFYQQAVRQGTGITNSAAIDGVTRVWWSLLSTAPAHT